MLRNPHDITWLAIYRLQGSQRSEVGNRNPTPLKRPL